MAKARTRIPDNIAAEVLFRHDAPAALMSARQKAAKKHAGIHRAVEKKGRRFVCLTLLGHRHQAATDVAL